MMTNPTLWNYDLDDACYRVRLMASLSGVTLDLRSVDAFPGNEHLGDEMLALNPLGRLPVLEHGALTLCQTEAILLHLARIGPRGAAFVPSDDAGAARMRDWLFFGARDLAAPSQARAVAMLGAAGDAGALNHAARHGLRLLEDHMTAQGFRGQGFVAGARATVADIALFPAFALCRDFNLDHDAFPALRLWARRVRQLDGFITMPGIPDYH
ncbi:MAG: glutathione S-transferase family protein [Rhodobacteraceae bacterium]|nr:glutathione S-transferase family protein [Paracoccaceae bacterium]